MHRELKVEADAWACVDSARDGLAARQDTVRSSPSHVTDDPSLATEPSTTHQERKVNNVQVCMESTGRDKVRNRLPDVTDDPFLGIEILPARVVHSSEDCEDRILRPAPKAEISKTSDTRDDRLGQAPQNTIHYSDRSRTDCLDSTGTLVVANEAFVLSKIMAISDKRKKKTSEEREMPKDQDRRRTKDIKVKFRRTREASMRD